MLNEDNLVTVYPNPNNGEFSISTIEDAHIIITNDLGRVVKEVLSSNSNNYKVEMTDLSNGIYFAIVKVKGQTIAKKISITE